MYRPDNWDEIKLKNCEVYSDVCECSDCQRNRRNFEAGADAYEEALKKGGTYFKKGEWTDDATFETDNPGWVVFIPEEE